LLISKSGIYIATWDSRRFVSQAWGEGLALTIAYLLKNHFRTMIGNDSIREVDALMYVVLSRVEKHVIYGEFVGTAECVTL